MPCFFPFFTLTIEHLSCLVLSIYYGMVKNCCPFFSKPLFYGSNSIPRMYTALYLNFPVVCISELIEFRLVSMSMLPRCEVVLEFLPLILQNYVLITSQTFVLLSIMFTWPFLLLCEVIHVIYFWYHPNAQLSSS